MNNTITDSHDLERGVPVITGNPVLQEIDGRREFVFQPGPLFTNIVLADEINRASPKTQSALLEAMQERRVTVLGKTHDLPKPFFVLATQNPIELEGTYPLPEAQLDRFLFKLEVTRNDVATLQRIVSHRELGTDPQVDPVMSAETLGELLELVRRIYLPDVVANYIARLVDASHPGQSAASRGIRYGASPRAALALASGAKARALMQERTNASFEDVKAIAPAVLRHRIVLDYNARVEGHTTNDIVRILLDEVPFQSNTTLRAAAVHHRATLDEGIEICHACYSPGGRYDRPPPAIADHEPMGSNMARIAPDASWQRWAASTVAQGQGFFNPD